MHHGSNIRPCNAVAKVAHVCAQTTRDSAAWAGHCSAKKHAALRPTNSPAQAQISGPAPLQLQVVLVRGEGELSLRTSNGANHAQRDQQIILGTNPGRDSNGMAFLVNMVSRQRRLEGQHLLAEEVGAHLAEEAIQTIKVHLQAGALDVSQPLLDTDQERHHPQVGDVSNDSNQWLEQRGTYLWRPPRTPWTAFEGNRCKRYMEAENKIEYFLPSPLTVRAVYHTT